MQQYLIVIYIVAVPLIANGLVQDLRVDVFPMQTRFAAVKDVNVVLKYSNTGNDTMSIYEWCVPENGLHDSLFEMTRNGKPVEYVGPMFKRRTPTSDDVISIAPGTTVRTVVRLSSVYNMTQSGNYVIQYKMKADQVVFTMDSTFKRKMASFDDSQTSILQSSPVIVFSLGQQNQIVEETRETTTKTRMLTPTYSMCTSNQANYIQSAVSVAESYANNAIQYLNTQSSATTRYSTWFGQYSHSNKLQMVSHFSKIQSALGTKSLSFDCSCPAASSNTYAYVYPTLHYKIYLCSQFWKSTITGTDSMGGTIIHELAHFQILANTGDHAYGHSGAKILASTNPTYARMNSDNLQYFAENYPPLY